MSHRKNTRLTDEDLKKKERFMRTKVPDEVVRRGSGRVSKDFWDLLWTEDPDSSLLNALVDERKHSS